MLSEKAFKLLSSSINCAYFLKAIPFKWDKELKRVTAQQTTKLQFLFWKLNMILLWFILLFMVVRFIQSYINGTLTITTGASFLVLMNFHILFAILQYVYVCKLKELIAFINHFVQYFTELEGKQ